MNRDATIVARRLAQNPRLNRQSWRTLIGAARDLADEAAGRTFGYVVASKIATARQRLEDFKHLLCQARDCFPVEGASAALMAEGFVKVCRAFAEAADPERRTAFAGVMGAAADCLDDLLEAQRCADAADYNRRHGVKVD